MTIGSNCAIKEVLALLLWVDFNVFEVDVFRSSSFFFFPVLLLLYSCRVSCKAMLLGWLGSRNDVVVCGLSYDTAGHLMRAKATAASLRQDGGQNDVIRSGKPRAGNCGAGARDFPCRGYLLLKVLKTECKPNLTAYLGLLVCRSCS